MLATGEADGGGDGSPLAGTADALGAGTSETLTDAEGATGVDGAAEFDGATDATGAGVGEAANRSWSGKKATRATSAATAITTPARSERNRPSRADIAAGYQSGDMTAASPCTDYDFRR